MLNIETFLLGLMVISTVTGLVTEAIKKILLENNSTFKSNTLAGIVSVVVSALVVAGYIVVTNTQITPVVIVCAVALTVMGWLCAMIGYDKVVQTISQFTTNSKGE